MGVDQGDWWLSKSDTGVDHLGERLLLFLFSINFFCTYERLKKTYSASDLFPLLSKGQTLNLYYFYYYYYYF